MTKANSGMQLAQAFFAEELYPYLQKNFPRLLTISAIGLVGPGSECLGYDDDYSKDHDFERRCCIWLHEKYLKSSKEIVNQLKVD